MERALISDLHRVAKDRPPGYLEACMSKGCASLDGLWWEWTDEEHASIRKSFSPISKNSGRGLGDLVSTLATPIARALNMDCIDPATKQLKPESDCAERKAWLNKIRIGGNVH